MESPSIYEYFSSTMPEADAKFRAACRKMGGEAYFHRHPLSGPKGEILQTGEFLYGPKDTKKAIIFASGMHGIEGYAGAALQVGVMESGALNEVPDDIAVLFVHMINPWGCAWDRDVNEDNVDIFRNFLYGEKPAPPNPEYDAINEFINPSEWTGPVKEKTDSDLAAYIEKHGIDSVARTIRRGQHNHPKGVTFHGNGSTWSRLTTETIVKRNLGHAKKIAGVDLHTGFGPYGETTVVSYDDMESERRQRFINWYGDAVHFAGDHPAIPKHEMMALEALVNVVPNAEIFGVGIEWGAEQYSLEDFKLILHMNYLQNYGDLSAEEAKEPRRRFRSFLYGETNEWRKKAWKNGLEVFHRTIAGASKWFD